MLITTERKRGKGFPGEIIIPCVVQSGIQSCFCLLISVLKPPSIQRRYYTLWKKHLHIQKRNSQMSSEIFIVLLSCTGSEAQEVLADRQTDRHDAENQGWTLFPAKAIFCMEACWFCRDISDMCYCGNGMALAGRNQQTFLQCDCVRGFIPPVSMYNIEF